MKIAIVGSKPDTWNKVPDLGPDWEVWRFSRRNWNKPPKFDRWFELHDKKNYPRYEQSLPGYVGFLKSDPRVVLPDSFPFEGLIRQFGRYFFCHGQAPWIMAYAITHDPQTIGLWGIDAAGQYKPQRAEIQYFASIAKYRGIEVIAPEDDVLQPSKLYGLETDSLQALLDKMQISEERQKELYANPPKLSFVGNHVTVAVNG